MESVERVLSMNVMRLILKQAFSLNQDVNVIKNNQKNNSILLIFTENSFIFEVFAPHFIFFE